MKFCSLASGSAGNATFVSSGDTRILVDNGLSVKELTKRMAEMGESPQDLTGIVVSHAHTDHTSGLVRLARFAIGRGRVIPIYATRPTAEAINWDGLESPPLKYFDAGRSFEVGSIQVSSFTVPHDCADPVAFTLADNHSKVGIATDLGFIPPALISRFRSCDAVLIESNYDPDMLQACDRPTAIKLRIAGRNGHLSNNEVQSYLRTELSSTVRTVILAHLSQETNLESMAHAGALEILQTRLGSGRPDLLMARQDKVTGVVEI